MEGVPLLGRFMQGVGVPYPDIRQGIQPFLIAGSVPGTPNLLKVCQHPDRGGTDAFQSFQLLHDFHTAAGAGAAVQDPPLPSKPSLGFRAVPPPELPEATWSLQPQWWLFPHFNEEYLSNVLIISHQTSPEAASVHMPVEMALCSF